MNEKQREISEKPHQSRAYSDNPPDLVVEDSNGRWLFEVYGDIKVGGKDGAKTGRSLLGDR